MPDGLSAHPAFASDGVVEHHGGGILDRIADGSVVLSIWHRSSAAETTAMAAWLDSLPPEQLPAGRFLASPGQVPAGLAALCASARLGESSMRDALIADIAGLATDFARLACSTLIDVRLEAIDDDACWRFHRDHVGLRLNATYRGAGTQWVRPASAARALRAQRRYRGPLEELPRFAAGLFKGVQRAGSRAIVHRSPRIAGSGAVRLFLCLNEPATDE